MSSSSPRSDSVASLCSTGCNRKVGSQKMGPTGFERIQVGSNGFRRVQMGSKEVKWVQMGSNGFKCVQTGSNGFEHVQSDVPSGFEESRFLFCEAIRTRLNPVEPA